MICIKKNIFVWDKKLAAEVPLASDYSKHSGKLRLAAVADCEETQDDRLI